VVHQYATTLAVLQEHCNFTWMSPAPLDDLELVDLYEEPVAAYAVQASAVTNKYFLRYRQLDETERVEASVLVTRRPVDLAGKQGFLVVDGAQFFALREDQSLQAGDMRGVAPPPLGASPTDLVLLEYVDYDATQYRFEGTEIERVEDFVPVASLDPARALVTTVAALPGRFAAFYATPVDAYTLRARVAPLGVGDEALQLVDAVYTESRASVNYDADRGAVVEHLPFQYKLGGPGQVPDLVTVPNLGFLVRLRNFERTTAFFDFSQFLIVDPDERDHALKVHFARISDPWYPYGRANGTDAASPSDSAQMITEQIYDLLPGVGSYGEYRRFVANYQNLYNPTIDLAILFNTLIREKRLMLYKHACVRAYIDAESQRHLRQYGNLQRFQVHCVDDIIPVSMIEAILRTLPPFSAALVMQSAAFARFLRSKVGARAKEIARDLSSKLKALEQVAPFKVEDVLRLLGDAGVKMSGPEESALARIVEQTLQKVEVPTDYLDSQNFTFPTKSLAAAPDLLAAPLFQWDDETRAYDAYNGLLPEAAECDRFRPALATLLPIVGVKRGRQYADLTALDKAKLGTEKLVSAIARNGAELRNLFDTSRLATSTESMAALLSSLNRQSDAFIAQGSQGFIHRVTIDIEQPSEAQVVQEYRQEVARCESTRAQARQAPLEDVSRAVDAKVARFADEFAVGQLPPSNGHSVDVNRLVEEIVQELYPGKTPEQIVQEQRERPDEAQIRQIVDAMRQHLQREIDAKRFDPAQLERAEEEADAGLNLGADPRAPTTTRPRTLKVHAAIKSFKSGLPPGNPADYITISENNIQSPELVNETMISAIVSTLYEKGLSPNFMLTYAVFMAKYTPRSLSSAVTNATATGGEAAQQFFASVFSQDPLLKSLLDLVGDAFGAADGGDFNRVSDVDVPPVIQALIRQRDLPEQGLQFYAQLSKLVSAFATRALNEQLLRDKVDGVLQLLDNYAAQGLLKGDTHMEAHLQLVLERLRGPLPVDDDAQVLDLTFYLAMALNLVAAIDPDAANLVFLDLRELTLRAPEDYLQQYHALSIGDRLDRTFEEWVRGKLLLSGKLSYQDHVRAVSSLTHSPAVEAATRSEIYLIQELIQDSFSKFRSFVSKLQRALLKEKKPLPSFDQYVTNALQQVVYSLQLFQDYFNGVHGDLHPDNVFVKYCDETLYRGVPLHMHEEFVYELRGRTYRVKNMGFIVKLGDMGHSSINVGITGKPYLAYDAALQKLVTDQVQNRKQIHKEIKLGMRELSLRLVNEQLAVLQQLIAALPEFLANNLDSGEKILDFLRDQQVMPGYFQNSLLRGREEQLARGLLSAAQLINAVSPKTMIYFLQSVQAFGLSQLAKVDLVRLLSNLAKQLQLITKMRSVNRFLPAFDMSNCFQNLSYDCQFYQTPMVSLFCALEVALETARFGRVDGPKNFERSLPNMYPLVVTKAINLVQFNEYLSRGFTFLTTPEQMVHTMREPRRLQDLGALSTELRQGEQFAARVQLGAPMAALPYVMQQRTPLSCKVCRQRARQTMHYDAAVCKIFCSARCVALYK
jgi:hypothetical protein